MMNVGVSGTGAACCTWVAGVKVPMGVEGVQRCEAGMASLAWNLEPLYYLGFLL